MSEPATIAQVRSRIAEIQEFMGLIQAAHHDIALLAEHGDDVAEQCRELHQDEGIALIATLDVLDLIEGAEAGDLSAPERTELEVLRERVMAWELIGNLEQ